MLFQKVEEKMYLEVKTLKNFQKTIKNGKKNTFLLFIKLFFGKIFEILKALQNLFLENLNIFLSKFEKRLNLN